MSQLNAAVLSVAGVRVPVIFITSLIIDKTGKVLLFLELNIIVNYCSLFKGVIGTQTKGLQAVL